jgi:hypothetical protein
LDRSESEKSLDPDPGKLLKKFFEKSQINHLKEKKHVFQLEYFFSLTYRYRYMFQTTYESSERHHLENFQVKILAQESVSEFKKIKNCGSESEKNDLVSTTLV